MLYIVPQKLELQAAQFRISQKQWGPTELHYLTKTVPCICAASWRVIYQPEEWPWYRTISIDNFYEVKLPRIITADEPVHLALLGINCASNASEEEFAEKINLIMDCCS